MTGDTDLNGNFVTQGFDMTDYAHAFAAAAMKAAEHAYGPLERFAAESAETFVDKQNIG